MASLLSWASSAPQTQAGNSSTRIGDHLADAIRCGISPTPFVISGDGQADACSPTPFGAPLLTEPGQCGGISESCCGERYRRSGGGRGRAGRALVACVCCVAFGRRLPTTREENEDALLTDMEGAIIPTTLDHHSVRSGRTSRANGKRQEWRK